MSILAQQQGLTPALARQSPQVSGLRKADEDGVAEALSNLLIFTAAQFNVVRNLTDMQIMLLANELPARYWHWRLDEFAYVLKEAVAGRWGKVYDRLDPPTVQEWCAAYDAERQELVATEAESEAAKLKASEKQAGPPTDMARAYLKARMEAQSDDVLCEGYDYYRANPTKPEAALKCELAMEILAERETARKAGPTAAEREAAVQRFKANDFASRMQRLTDEHAEDARVVSDGEIIDYFLSDPPPASNA
jgi:hypothetical protein